MIRSYTETYDLNTEVDCPTLLGVHTPIGPQPYTFLSPCFRMYRKYAYLGCDLTVVNASKLPVSPEAFAVDGGTTNVSPLDTLNPIMFKGCHGDSMGKVLDSMYGGLASDIFRSESIDKEQFSSTLANFYYTALGDDSWRKCGIQNSFRIRGLHPLVYQIATNLQIAPSNNTNPLSYSENNTAEGGQTTVVDGSPQYSLSTSARAFAVPTGAFYDVSTGTYKYKVAQSFFTNKMTKLGWMDTMNVVNQSHPSNPTSFESGMVAQLPKLFMGLLLIPPAVKAYTYLRVIVRHKFAFKDYRTITTGIAEGVNAATTGYGYNNFYTGGLATQNTMALDLDPVAEVDEVPVEVEREINGS